MNKKVLHTDIESINERIDSYLCQKLENLTRSAIQRLVEEGNVLVNGKTIKKNYKISPNDEITINIPPVKEINFTPQEIPLDVVYEDNDLIVINKAKGMVVHPAAGNYENTLVNALLAHCKGSLSGINGVARPGIIHRLDKDTSGLLIVAKNDTAHLELAKQIKEHSVIRVYEAIAYGRVKNENGQINAPIGRNPNDRKKMAVTNKNSKSAITNYEVIAYYNGYTHIRCRLETGRTHQIRVHMASIGNPLLGDIVYGHKWCKAFDLDSQCLHSKYIEFTHPKTKERLSFETELPNYFKELLTKLGKMM